MDNSIFRQSLNDLVNLKIKTPKALVSFIVSKNLFYKRKASDVENHFSKYIESGNSHVENKVSVKIFPYTGNNFWALKMKYFLISHLKNDLIDAIVHGSIATHEEINYSDFDG